MENTDTNTNDKVQIAARVDAAIFDEISRIATDEDRTVSNVVGILLKSHPRIQPILEPATAGAGN